MLPYKPCSINDKGEKKMKNTKDFNAYVMEKKAILEIAEDLMVSLSTREEDHKKEWAKVGESQRTDRDGNLLWLDENNERTTEDTGKPCMRDDYDYVEKKSFDAKDEAYFNAIEKIREAIASLV